MPRPSAAASRRLLPPHRIALAFLFLLALLLQPGMAAAAAAAIGETCCTSSRLRLTRAAFASSLARPLLVGGLPTSAGRSRPRGVVVVAMSSSSAAKAAQSQGSRREFKTLAGPTEYEEIIKKSRFLTRAAPCASFQEAQEFLRQVSDPKATHNCWAYRSQLGEERSSDDGEPGGTAGRPMAAAIESEGLVDVMVVVTRYFGGIKLGAGGLVRAYGGVARNCLRNAETLTIVPKITYRVRAPLALSGAVFQTISRAGGDKAGEDYTETEVIVDVRLEAGGGAIDELRRLLQDATKGAGTVEECVDEGG